MSNHLKFNSLKRDIGRGGGGLLYFWSTIPGCLSPTEVLYDLGGARVQAVEVDPLLPEFRRKNKSQLSRRNNQQPVKANPCVAVNASQPVHQLPEF